jgi:hypothetical protein
MCTIKRFAAILSLVGVMASSAKAEPNLSPELAPLAFMIGEWSGGGKTENGGSAHGISSIQAIVSGGALLRRDHIELSNVDGKPAGSFDQIMLIYAEQGAIHADYLDGTHVIHYVRADIEPNAVSFLSAEQSGKPVFRLIYSKTASATMHITFGMKPPGQSAFATIAEGDAQRK